MSHQAKKPYAGSGSQQSSITSYFSPTGTNGVPQARDTNSLAPPEPPSHIQSNLLSVGMRIRKSVPEGYKTGKYSAFMLFSEPSASPSATPAQRRMPPRSISTPAVGRQTRELTPWCGILKVGGLAQQVDLVDDEEDGWEPCSSQESAGSDASVVSREGGNRKRIFEEEEEGDESEELQTVMGQRVLAVPRRKKSDGLGKGFMVGQENEGMDFEEAGFLDYSVLDEVDMADV